MNLTAGARMFSLRSMAVETLGQAFSLGWRVSARYVRGKRDTMKSCRECLYSQELDMQTLVWTRGKSFPLSLLASRLRCPRCGSNRVSVIFETTTNENLNRLAAQPPLDPIG